MKTTIFTLFLMLIIPLAYAQSDGDSRLHSKGQYYEGTINKNLKIQMYLEYKGDEGNRAVYEGWYYYESQGSNNKIQLKGIYFSAQFILDKTVNGKSTGQFRFFPADESYQGEWIGENGKTFAVELKEK